MKLYRLLLVYLALACSLPAWADNGAKCTVSTQNLAPTGTATDGSSCPIVVTFENTIAVQPVGTYTGALSLQVTNDSVNWVTRTGSVFTDESGTSTATIPSGGTGIYRANVGGYAQVRISALAAVTGSAVTWLRVSGVNGQAPGSSTAVSGTVTANAGTNLNTSALATEATLAAQSAKLPGSLGAKTSAASLSVVPASDAVFPTTPSLSASLGWPSKYQGTVAAIAIAAIAAPASIAWIGATNTNSTMCYLQMFDTPQGSVTVGVTTPVLNPGVPANGAGTVFSITAGSKWTNAWTIAATTTPTGSVACSMQVNAIYQ